MDSKVTVSLSPRECETLRGIERDLAEIANRLDRLCAILSREKHGNTKCGGCTNNEV